MFLKPKTASISPWPFKLPRKTVRWFAGLMEKVLRDNDYKGGWEKEKDGNDVFFFRRKLAEEVEELQDLLTQLDFGQPVDATEIAREAADVANVAMMIADNWGRTAEHTAEHRRQGKFLQTPEKFKHAADPLPLRAATIPAEEYKGCE